MSRWMLAAGLLMLASPALAEIPDPGKAQVDARVNACIDTHAAEVERVEPSLTAATDFLVNDLCAQEIDIAVKYATNQSMLSQQIKQTNQMLDSEESQPAPTPPVVRPSGAGATPALPTFDRAKMIATQRKHVQDLEQSTVDPETGEIVGPAQNTSQVSNDFVSLLFGRAPVPARFRARAARALLAARQARTAH